MTARILLVEDDRVLREALFDTLHLGGYECVPVADAEHALQALAKTSFELVLSDVNMPGMDGHGLLEQVRKQYPQVPVLLMTAFAAVERAVAAMRMGAADYLVKPFEPKVLLAAIAEHAQGQVVNLGGDAEPIAQAPASQQLMQMARRVAQSDSTVLISGESGTGKEVLARFIHRQSARAAEPFVAINCAAIPDNMLEATLFGHEKGAFTGAIASQPGKFEQANGGTLLLDEISEMPLALQAKLLRVLQEREVERVGGRRPITLDIRVLATTNRDLSSEVTEGRFREDLFYRLSVFPLVWPALRARPEDILPLAQRLLRQRAVKMGQRVPELSVAAEQALLSYAWPGNVRELDNAIQRALILQQGGIIAEQDLCLPTLSSTPAVLPSALMAACGTEGEAKLESDLRRHEFLVIMEALKAERGRRKEAAERLGISARTLRYKLAQMRDAGFDVESVLKSA